MSIRQLPDDVVRKLQSSVVITSLNSVVAGLLKNSLDAGATNVNITVDFARGNCTVEDNGSGIPPSEFEVSGGLAKHHHTSRFPHHEHIYGRHGDFLASLATFSLLLVSSRHRHHVSHNSMMVHNSKPKMRNTPAPPEHRIQAFDHGTRVLVRDLFGSMPVRVKHRATLFSERQNVDKHWWQLVHDIVAILISWPLSISVSLKDLTTYRELRLRSLDASNVSVRSSRIISQAFLPNARDDGDWVPVSGHAGSVILKGCVSTRPVATRRCQFISLGIEPVDNKDDVNILYEETNKMFKNSDFGMALAENVDPRGLESVVTQTNNRKGIERWPMFFFQIRVQSAGQLLDADNLCFDRPRDFHSILTLIRIVSFGFLKKHGFRPREEPLKSARKTPDASTSTTNKSIVQATNGGQAGAPFDGWKRIKIGHAVPTSRKGHRRNTPDSTTIPTKNRTIPLISSGGQLLRKPFEDPEITGGNEDAVESDYFKDEPANRRSPRCPLTPQQKLLRNSLVIHSENQPSTWLQGVLDSWENPVFESTSAPIPRAYNDNSAQSRESGNAVRSRHFPVDKQADEIMLESSSVSLAGRVSKLALREAKVIAQVDRKFILVKLPLENVNEDSRKESSSALVVLDQHAVDERCQLEGLMADFFDPSDHDREVLETKTESLDPPLLFELSKEEGQMLKQNLSYFSAWGININVGPSIGAGKADGGHPQEDSSHVAVVSLPPSIIGRCRTEPRLIIDLLRKEIWNRIDSGQCALPLFSPPNMESNVISNFYGCPKGILELLYSRSCRSAIMFNDVLQHEECVALLQKLSRCSFPFQCAHGRPSMAPLVDLGIASKIGGWCNDRHALKSSAWATYQEK